MDAQVKTLLGRSEAEKVDGEVDRARFNRLWALALGEQGRLLVVDLGNTGCLWVVEELLDSAQESRCGASAQPCKNHTEWTTASQRRRRRRVRKRRRSFLWSFSKRPKPCDFVFRSPLMNKHHFPSPCFRLPWQAVLKVSEFLGEKGLLGMQFYLQCSTI